MPANFPGRATKVPQSKLYIGLFLITVYTLMLTIRTAHQRFYGSVQWRQGWPGLLDNA
jgi:hypothetical protein